MSKHLSVPFRAASFLAVLVIASCTLGLGGCTATLQTRPLVVSSEDEVTWDNRIPVDVEQYPHESYGGRDVYLIGGSWHYRSGGRWATYRREPRELGRRRARPAPRREPERRAPEHDERRAPEREDHR